MYGLVDPLEPERIRYVGFTGTNPLKRYAGHIGSRCPVYPSPKERWIAGLLAAGRFPSMVLLEVIVGDARASEREDWWIDSLRRWGQADTNATGYNLSFRGAT